MKRPCICIVAGLALGEVLAYSITARDMALAISLCAVVIILCAFFMLRPGNAKAGRWRVLVILGLAFLCGSIRLLLDMRTHRQYDSLNALCDGDVGSYAAEVTGITEKGERLTLRCGELIVYYTPGPDEQIAIGNRIRIAGDFSAMDKPSNPGEFNYYLYYLAQGVTHKCFADSIEVTDSRVNTIPDAIFRLRRELLRRIDAIYNDDDSGVLRAVLLGDKSELSEDINDIYRKNGIAHLLAISGLHVGIIGMSLYNLLRRRLKLPYAICGLVCGAWMLLYCLLTGSGVSTVRATLMLLIMFLAGAAGRHYDMLNSAGLAAFIILIIHPYQLFNCGFLLSFACIAAIAGPAPFIIHELGIKNAILKSFVLSLTVQLFTLPITAYFFFEVSPYGCLLNLIVIPLMTFVVWSSLIALLLTFVWPALSFIIAYVSHYILTFYTWLGSITLQLPQSTILIGRPSLWQIFAYYFLFFLVLYSSRLKALIPPSLLSTSDRVTASISAAEKTSS